MFTRCRPRPTRKTNRFASGRCDSVSVVACWNSMLADRASTALTNSIRAPSPVRLTIRPPRRSSTGCNRSARTMPDTLTIVVPNAKLRAALATALVDLGHRLEAAVGQPITFVIFAGRVSGGRRSIRRTRGTATCSPRQTRPYPVAATASHFRDQELLVDAVLQPSVA